MAVVGGASNPVGRLVRKATVALGNAEKEGRTPTLIFINQPRFAIGTPRGQNPEYIPGGMAQKHMASMWLRLHSKPTKDPLVSKVLPVLRETTVTLKKFKVPVVADACEYKMILIPHKGLEVGRSHDFPTAEKYLKEFGWMTKAEGKTKAGKGWQYDQIPGEVFSSQVKLWEALREDIDGVRDRIVAELMTGT